MKGLILKAARKRFFYSPGTISLIMFLPFSMFWFINNNVFNPLRIMEVNYYEPTVTKHGLTFPPKRKFVNINLNDDHDEQKLDSVRLLIKTMVASNDTTTGMRIHFADQSKYGSFVRALDICERENVRYFVLYQNDLWIFHRVGSKSPSCTFFLCGTYMSMPADKKIDLTEKLELPTIIFLGHIFRSAARHLSFSI